MGTSVKVLKKHKWLHFYQLVFSKCWFEILFKSDKMMDEIIPNVCYCCDYKWFVSKNFSEKTLKSISLLRFEKYTCTSKIEKIQIEFDLSNKQILITKKYNNFSMGI